MLRSCFTVLVVLSLVSGGGIGVSDGSPAVPGGARTPQSSSAFGFDVGEERRYVLGPPEALDPGESATWMIRLERVRDNGEAVFALQHQRSGPNSTTGTPAYGEELSAEMDGELTVNPHGFPTRVEIDVLRSFYGYADDSYHVRYTFDGRDFKKRVFGKQWDIAIPISAHRHLDKSVPIGLYLFLPDAFHCVGYRPSVARMEQIEPVQLSPGRGLSPASMPQVRRYARPCEPNTDLGFLNPGLLSLAWPAVIEEASREKDFLFFTPTGADLATVGGGIDRARYYAYSTIKIEGETTIRLRGRTLDVIAARIGSLVGTVYFGERGKALLVEINASRFILANVLNVIGGGMVTIDPDDLEDRFIRLMFPSEY